MEDTSYLLISHTSYTDILDIYLRQNKKYFPDIPIILAINDVNYIKNTYDNEFQFKKLIQYDVNLPYGARMKFILEQLTTSYVLVNHDSNVIVDTPNLKFLNDIINFMKLNNVDQVRLSDAGIGNIVRNNDIFHKNNGPYYMSALTAIWNTNSLLSMYSNFTSHDMRCIECEEIQTYVSKLNNYYITSYNDIVQDKCHCINYYFPICHVTHLGRWFTQGAANCKYINNIATMYNINLNIRGMY
jgi:hypothetical protein